LNGNISTLVNKKEIHRAEKEIHLKMCHKKLTIFCYFSRS